MMVGPRSGLDEANDYTVIPNEGWPVGDNVFTIEGDLLSTLYTQTRNFTVPASDYEPDMEQVAKDRFIHQFKEKVLLDAWSDAYVGQLQELENAMEDMLHMRQPSNAVGKQLDAIGEIWNIPRGGRLGRA